MWIAMNDSFVSIVQHKEDKKLVVVRARVKKDLINLFPRFAESIITTDKSDYRFRLILDKDFVSSVISRRVDGIDYENFKDSVQEPWRKAAYMKIWQIMLNIQDRMYGIQEWWLSYRR